MKLYEYRYQNESFEIGKWYAHSIDRHTSTDNTVQTRESTSTAILHEGRPALEVFTIDRVERPGRPDEASTTRDIIYFDDGMPAEGEFERGGELPTYWDIESYKQMADVVVAEGDQASATQKHGMLKRVSDTGTTVIEAHIGTVGNDHMQGQGLLYGADGDDSFHAHAHDSVLVGGDGWDMVSYIEAGEAVTVNLSDASQNTGSAAGDLYAGVENIAGTKFNDELTGDDISNALHGSFGEDTLSGLAGDDSLSGSEGYDTLIGGSGADSLDGGAGYDFADYTTAKERVVVDLIRSKNYRNRGDAAGDIHISIEGVVGSAYNDALAGSHAANELYGKGGDDTLEGRSSADLLDGGAGYDFASYYHATAGVVANLSNRALNTGEAAGDGYISIEALEGSRFDDTLTGNADGNNLYGHEGNDRLVGLAGRDYIVGGGGDDVLEGGAEGDWLIGGAGIDFVSYTTAVTVNLWEAWHNTGEAAGDSYDSIEGIYGSNYADKLIGNGLNNTIYGGWGEDTLSGLLGDDHLLAGDSNDLVDGGLGADTLDGGNGSDNLVGGAGSDYLDGGEGFDYAGYFTSTSGVVADLLRSWRNTGDAAGDSYVSIEGIGGSDYKDELAGNHLGNELYGNGGDDTLEGRGGADWLYGGAGYDFASYYFALEGVVANLSESWRNSGEAAGDIYSSIEALAGSQFNDTLTGNGVGNNLYGHEGNDRLVGLAGRDYIVGGGGDDVLEGGADGDWLIGGAGTDFVAYTTGVTANLTDASQNTGEAAGDTYEGIEGIYGSNYADKLTGNAVNNTFYGGWGEDVLMGMAGNDYLLAGDSNDVLDGGAGADWLDGGNGYDFVAYTTGVTVNMSNAAYNTGEAYGDVFVSIEGIYGSNAADTLTGNSADNTFYGGWGEDVLSGRDGNDRLLAGDSNDVLEGGWGADTMDGGNGYDFASYLNAVTGVRVSLANSAINSGEAYGDVYGSIEALNGSQFSDVLIGDAGNNSLYGQNGNDELVGGAGADFLSGGLYYDTLSGGAGADTLSGGSAADVFQFDAVLGAGNVDTLADFSAAEGDKIALETHIFGFQDVAFVETTYGSYYVNHLLKASAFGLGGWATTSAQRIVYNQATGGLFYDADGTGNSLGNVAQVQFAQLTAGTALSAANFSLYTL
ncbi:calcium-binding protein [Microvirga sp. CF3062]|uniref:calcium-binding protein n=1 Tax=Microvirga sp. CF3062 TaxID=3110182 RepID=UPI002E760CD3|nr:calcium-binding protein [Microvirga sp. CF3062]MEE1656350.1 calcium-binding protein [Microvirga sp. CF3062]